MQVTDKNIASSLAQLLQLVAQQQFSPQGNTGGGVNMPGYLPDGRRASQRSESTEFEKTRRDTPAPYSILGELLNPNGAAFNDAIRRRNFGIMDSTGYDYRNQPGSKSY